MTISSRDWKSIIGTSFAFGVGVCWSFDFLLYQPEKQAHVILKEKYSAIQKNVKISNEYISLQTTCSTYSGEADLYKQQLQACNHKNLESVEAKHQLGLLKNSFEQANNQIADLRSTSSDAIKLSSNIIQYKKIIENNERAIAAQKLEIQRLKSHTNLTQHLEIISENQEKAEGLLKSLLSSGSWTDAKNWERSRLENKIKNYQSTITSIFNSIKT